MREAAAKTRSSLIIKACIRGHAIRKQVHEEQQEDLIQMLMRPDVPLPLTESPPKLKLIARPPTEEQPQEKTQENPKAVSGKTQIEPRSSMLKTRVLDNAGDQRKTPLATPEPTPHENKSETKQWSVGVKLSGAGDCRDETEMVSSTQKVLNQLHAEQELRLIMAERVAEIEEKLHHAEVQIRVCRSL